jgi:hypothetical protein
MEIYPHWKTTKIKIDQNGYEHIKANDGRGGIDSVYHHQLIAIADGADPYKVFSSGKYHCHHKIPIPWLNYSKNIEFLSISEHMIAHMRNEGVSMEESVYQTLLQGATLDELVDATGYDKKSVLEVLDRMIKKDEVTWKLSDGEVCYTVPSSP